MRGSTAVALTALLATAGCSNGPQSRATTEVLLTVDATSAVRTRTTRLHVEVSGSASRDGPFSGLVVEDYGPPASPVGFPRHFALVPQDGDAKRFFEARAFAFDSSGMEITETVVRSGYVEHELLELRIVLDDACSGISCPTGQTCRHGMCQAIFVDPMMLPHGDGGTPTPDGGDAGVGMDGALPDGGSPVDGFVPPVDGGGGGDAGGNDAFVPQTCIGLVCDDGNACNGIETCSDGVCFAGAALICDDGIDCTGESCDPVAGCVHTPNDAACTAMMSGTCVVGSGCQYPSCTGATCASDPSTCMVASCSGPTCMRSSSCGPTEICCGGACAPAGCNDGNPCTDDACGMIGCTHTNNSGACSDGLSCTGPDHCAGGFCIAGPALCDDGNPCTDDTCAAIGCQHSGNTAPCSDGDPCSQGDHCDPSSATCIGGATHVYCDDANDCTIDFCDPSSMTGCGSMPIDGGGCMNEFTCRAGICMGGFCHTVAGSGCGSRRVCCSGTCSDPELCL